MCSSPSWAKGRPRASTGSWSRTRTSPPMPAPATPAWRSTAARINVYAIAGDGVKQAALEQGIDAVLAQFIKEGPSEEELEQAKGSLIASYIYSADNQASLAQRYGSNLVIGRTIADIEEWPARLGQGIGGGRQESRRQVSRPAILRDRLPRSRRRRPARPQQARNAGRRANDPTPAPCRRDLPIRACRHARLARLCGGGRHPAGALARRDRRLAGAGAQPAHHHHPLRLRGRQRAGAGRQGGHRGPACRHAGSGRRQPVRHRVPESRWRSLRRASPSTATATSSSAASRR